MVIYHLKANSSYFESQFSYLFEFFYADRSPDLGALFPGSVPCLSPCCRHCKMSKDEKRPLLGPEGSINDTEAPKATTVVVVNIYNGSNPVLVWFNGIYVKTRTGFSVKLFLMLVGLIIIGTANRVAFKIMTDSSRLRVDANGVSESKYSTFIAQVTNFIYMPVFWPIVWYFMAFTKRYDSFRL